MIKKKKNISKIIHHFKLNFLPDVWKLNQTVEDFNIGTLLFFILKQRSQTHLEQRT